MNATRLHHRQIVCSGRFVANSSLAKIDMMNGSAELLSRIRNRNLSSFDHSCTERFRNATITPANPASETAICALALSASLGCILNKIGFHPFLNQIRVHVKTVDHRSAAIENLRRGSVGEKETEIASENFVNVAKPRSAVVLRHEVELDQNELCFGERLLRAGQHRFLVALDIDLQERDFRKIDQ